MNDLNLDFVGGEVGYTSCWATWDFSFSFTSVLATSASVSASASFSLTGYAVVVRLDSCVSMKESAAEVVPKRKANHGRIADSRTTKSRD